MGNFYYYIKSIVVCEVTTSHATVCLAFRYIFVKTPIIKHADINPIFLEPISLGLVYTKYIQESSSKEVAVINLSFFLFFWFHFIIIIIFSFLRFFFWYFIQTKPMTLFLLLHKYLNRVKIVVTAHKLCVRGGRRP